ncbi:response regulator [Mumia qirimensis]|uniref:response regulator n=1 Tax=Mumia qirimensis TaxID=3234852 RepID=UPI00351D6CCC
MVLDVLVVDDDFMVARIHAAFVERTEGFAVAGTAHSAKDALEAVERLDPDVVLLDVHLPDGDGLSLLREIRAGGHDPAVLVITAERSAEAVKAALHGGAMHYLVKPFAYEDLRARLEHVRQAAEALAEGPRPPDQAEIDLAFGTGASPAAPSRPPLPKGLSRETAALVANALSEHDELSATECGAAVGISRVSARRYLEHFVDAGTAEVRLRYGDAGRPERRYRAR